MLKLAEGVGEVGESSDQWRIDVRRRLRLLVVGSLVGEMVVQVRPSHHCSDVNVRIGRRRVQEAKAGGALDLGWVHGLGRQGRTSMVNPLWVPRSIAYHV